MTDGGSGHRLRAIVAEEVRVLLARRRLSGVQLAHRIGRSQAYVSRRLTGETAFDLDDLEVIAREFGVKVSDLLAGEGTQTTGANLRVAERTMSRANRPAPQPNVAVPHVVNPARRRPGRIPAAPSMASAI